MKALRRELEEQIAEQLPENLGEEKIRVEVQKINEGEPIEPEKAKRVIEALLFASSKPLLPSEIKKIVGPHLRVRPKIENEEAGRTQGSAPTLKDIENWVSELREEYRQGGRSFEILEIAGGWELATKKEYAPWIFKIELDKKAKQVTQSALETLAILAYKQPVTRAEIEVLRGVDASGVMMTLVERGLIKIVGRKEVPGRPFLYGTTEKFLEHFGLKSLQDLPNIEEIKSLVEKSVKKEDLIGRPHTIISEGLPLTPPSPQKGEGEESAISLAPAGGEGAACLPAGRGEGVATDDLEQDYTNEESDETTANPQEN